MDYMEFDELMAEFISGTLSKEEAEKFLLLLKSDNKYKEKYKEMSEIWAKLYVPYFNSEKEENYRTLSDRLGFDEHRKMSYFQPSFFLRIASVILLCLMVSGITYFVQERINRNNHENLYTETVVPLGSQVTLVLPDGTSVSLNSGSILKYNQNFGKDSRTLSLEGEGYFKVAKDAKTPFILNTNGINIEVLGTIFNVKSYKEDTEIEVSLIEGKVDVFTDDTYLKREHLLPDESLIYNKETGLMTVSKADVARAALWTTRRLSFVNASLPDIMKDIQRKYDVQISIESEKMKTEYFSGSISSEYTLQQVLEFLDVDKKYKWIKNGNSIIIRDR